MELTGAAGGSAARPGRNKGPPAGTFRADRTGQAGSALAALGTGAALAAVPPPPRSAAFQVPVTGGWPAAGQQATGCWPADAPADRGLGAGARPAPHPASTRRPAPAARSGRYELW